MCGFLIYTHTERTSKRSHTHVDNHRIVNLFGFAVCLLYICYEINAKNTSQRKTHSLTGSQTHTKREKERGTYTQRPRVFKFGLRNFETYKLYHWANPHSFTWSMGSTLWIQLSFVWAVQSSGGNQAKIRIILSMTMLQSTTFSISWYSLRTVEQIILTLFKRVYSAWNRINIALAKLFICALRNALVEFLMNRRQHGISGIDSTQLQYCVCKEAKEESWGKMVQREKPSYLWASESQICSKNLPPPFNHFFVFFSVVTRAWRYHFFFFILCL